jgi:hypothetical protein
MKMYTTISGGKTEDSGILCDSITRKEFIISYIYYILCVANWIILFLHEKEDWRQSNTKFSLHTLCTWAHGGVVIMALCYKPAGRRFDS